MSHARRFAARCAAIAAALFFYYLVFSYLGRSGMWPNNTAIAAHPTDAPLAQSIV